MTHAQYNFIEYPTTLPPLTSKQLQKVLKACATDMHESLNLEKINPLLIEHKLIRDLFQSSTSFLSRKEKISKLISILSHKDSRALQCFVECLKGTRQGTAHGDLACQIEEQAEKVKPQHNRISGKKCSHQAIMTTVISFTL